MPHLVLADDSPAVRKIVRLTLAGENIELHSFAEGRSALQYLETGPVDLLLADVSLGEVDGYELCRVVRSNPSTSGVPVVLLVGALDSLDRERSAEVGCTLHLAKPLGTENLVGVVKELLRQPREATPAASREKTELASVPRFALSAMLCAAEPPSYGREINPGTGSRPDTIETSPQSTEKKPLQTDFLVAEIIERVQQELERILPEITRDVLKRHGL